jgi:hypothetical protein
MAGWVIVSFSNCVCSNSPGSCGARDVGYHGESLLDDEHWGNPNIGVPSMQIAKHSTPSVVAPRVDYRHFNTATIQIHMS